MADITLGNVAAGASADVTHGGVAGGTISAGDPLKRNSAGEFEAAQADDAANANVRGLALHDAIANQPIAYLTGGPLTITSGAVVGAVYVLSAAAAGGIAPFADLVSTNIVTVLGVASAAGTIEIKLHNSAVVVP